MPQKKTEDKISDDVTNGTSKAGSSRRKRSVKAKMANFETQDDVTKDPSNSGKGKNSKDDDTTASTSSASTTDADTSKSSRTRQGKNVTAAVSSKAKPNVINPEQSHKRASVSKAESTKPKLRKKSEEETLHK